MENVQVNERLARQNRMYRESLLVLCCVIAGFVAGVLFSNVTHVRTLQQSSKLGGIVIADKPFTLKPMIGSYMLESTAANK